MVLEGECEGTAFPTGFALIGMTAGAGGGINAVLVRGGGELPLPRPPKKSRMEEFLRLGTWRWVRGEVIELKVDMRYKSKRRDRNTEGNIVIFFSVGLTGWVWWE